jgi:hypothetical protein
MLTANEASFWQSVYNLAYYALLFGLFISFISTGLTFLASNRISADLTERLSQTTTTASVAHQKAAELEKVAANAKLEQEKLQKANLGTQLALESERKERLELEQKFAWRTLSPESEMTLSSELAIAGPSSVNIISLMNDSESGYYASRIAYGFVEGGWKVNLLSATYPGTTISGIVLKKQGNDETEIVQRVLSESGVGTVQQIDIGDPPMSFGTPETAYPVTIIIGAHIPN